MRNLKLAAAMVALLFATTVSAEATVIYDWVTKNVNSGTNGHDADSGCGFMLTAEIMMPEQAYFDRFFILSDRSGNLERSLHTSLQTLLSDGSYFEWSPPLYEWNASINGPFVTLSKDRSTITGFGEVWWDFGTLYGWPDSGVFLWDDMSNTLSLSRNHAFGGFFIGEEMFSEDRHPVTGDWRMAHFNFDGEWVLRESTAPAVPEPATFVLTGLGLAALYVWRRKAI